jgi:hypothetical protein
MAHSANVLSTETLKAYINEKAVFFFGEKRINEKAVLSDDESMITP